MLGIVKKDLWIMKTYAVIFSILNLLYLSTYLFIKVILFQSEIVDTNFPRTALSLLPIILIGEFNCKNFQYDSDHSSYPKYFNALPISPFKMVIGRFLGSALFSVCSLISSYFCLTCFTYFDKTSFSITLLKTPTIVFLCILIVLSIQLPVLSYNGNVILSYIFPAILFSTVLLILPLIYHTSINGIIYKLNSFYRDHSFISNNLLLLVFIITFFLCITSILISTQIYKRREF